jgi:hypothetical protein
MEPCGLFTQMAAEIFGVAGVGVGGVTGDALNAHQLSQRLFDGLHTVGTTGFDIGSELMIVSTPNQIADCTGGHEDFNGGIPIDSVDGGQEPLMDDSQQGERELTSHLRLEAGREDVEDT